jgi:hypothetical protein
LFTSCSFIPAANSTLQEAKVISFHISSDKTEYRRGEKALFSFIVANRGATPVYVARGFVCGKWTGFADFHVQNALGQNVENGGCDVVASPIPEDRLKQEITDSPAWLRLDPNEIYGEQRHFSLPSTKGSYRIVAELSPPQFSEQQRRLLASERILVLQARYVAPAVTIKVK